MCVHVREHTCDVKKGRAYMQREVRVFSSRVRLCEGQCICNRNLLRENKESCSSPVDGGRRDGVLQAVLEMRRGQDGLLLGRGREGELKRSWPGGRRQRESHIWGDAAIIHAQVGVVKKSIRLHFYDR